MNRIGRVLLILSCLILMVAALMYLLGSPIREWAWVPLALSGTLFLGEVFLDRQLYFQFLTLKTTKHGANMGLMILMVLAILVAVNFIGFRQNKKWDFTQEKINSLSDQTSKLLKGLDSDLEIFGFFREDSPEEERSKFDVRQVIDMLDDESRFVKYQVVNPIKEPGLTAELDVKLTPSLVLRYKGRTTSITELSEQAIANALIKVSRTRNKVIYHVTGQGELDFNLEQEGTGGSLLKKALVDSSYDVRPLNLMEKPQVPDDAEVVLILGPRQPYFEPQLKAIEDYAKRGGNLLVTLDPGLPHNLGPLLKKMGVVFEGTYIIDQVGQMVGSSAAVAIGLEYSQTSDITKNFTREEFTAFELASGLSRDTTAPADYRFEELVKSSPASFAKTKLSREVRMEGSDRKGPLVVGLSSTGAFPGAEADKKFHLVAFGDTEFLSNRLIAGVPTNRDLALNSVSFLAKDDDLVSIKPKQLATTRLTMSQQQAQAVTFGIYFPLPLLAFGFAVFLWLKRRGA